MAMQKTLFGESENKDVGQSTSGPTDNSRMDAFEKNIIRGFRERSTRKILSESDSDRALDTSQQQVSATLTAGYYKQRRDQQYIDDEGEVSSTIHSGYYKGGGRDQQYVNQEYSGIGVHDPNVGEAKRVYFSEGLSPPIKPNQIHIGIKIDGGSQGQRVYGIDNITPTLKSLGGGQGAKTGLFDVTPRFDGRDGRSCLKAERVPEINIYDVYNNRVRDECPALSDPCHNNIRVIGDEEVIPVLTPDREEKRQNGRRFKEDGEPSFTLTGQDIHGVMKGRKIRRLTPVECERLQAFEDGWTEYGIDDKGNKIEISDSQRYKQCGNAITTLVVKAIMEKIVEFDNGRL